MIEISYDQNMLAQVERKLGRMKSEAPKVLKNAINQTAKQARKDLATEAQKTYTVKAGGFNKAMKLKGATTSRLEATIKATGEPLPLKSFRISKAGGQIRAQVLKSGGLKPLERNGIKAFVNNVAKKDQERKKDTEKGRKGSKVTHIAVAQRLGDKRLKIKTLWSNSIPVMIGNEKRVYGTVKPHIKDNLKKNVNAQVRKVLGG